MSEVKADPPVQISVSCDFFNGTEGSVEKVDHVRAKIPQWASLHPPWRCERATQEASGQKVPVTPQRFALIDGIQE